MDWTFESVREALESKGLWTDTDRQVLTDLASLRDLVRRLAPTHDYRRTVAPEVKALIAKICVNDVGCQNDGPVMLDAVLELTPGQEADVAYLGKELEALMYSAGDVYRVTRNDKPEPKRLTGQKKKRYQEMKQLMLSN